MFNRKNNRIENILDDCLERILVSGESVDECLARYRQFASELEPLLRTAIATRKALAVEPRPEFKARARYQFHSALKEVASKKQRRFFGWQLRWVTMASLALTLLLSGGGIVAAASNSMPDSPLYQVKLATEQIQLFLTTSPEDKAELHAKLVDRRVAEIINMAEEGNVNLVETTTQRLDNHLSTIADISVKRTDGALLGGVMETQTESTVTATVTTTVAAEDILTDGALDAWPAAVTTTTAGDAVPTVAVPYATTLPTDSSDKGLSHQLRQQAADNIAALYTALESASEEVKPALMQAIAVLESGYNNALNAIGE